jgi:hypothetical protein
MGAVPDVDPVEAHGFRRCRDPGDPGRVQQRRLWLLEDLDGVQGHSWGDFKFSFPDSGIPVGTYKAVMTFEPTGAQVVQFFTVT